MVRLDDLHDIDEWRNIGLGCAIINPTHHQAGGDQHRPHDGVLGEHM